MGVDEEISQLEEAVRKLKIEYDVYFGGGSKRPPTDLEWRVQSLLKKYSDAQRLNFGQRFRFNTIQQRYALFSDLWRQKAKIKEEGYRRPQDALLSIAGMRHEQEVAAAKALHGEDAESKPERFSTVCSDVNADQANVQALYQAMVEARKKAGDNNAASFDSFKNFVQKKTEQLRKEYGCHSVEYSVEMENGQVRLKAKAKV